MDIKGFTTQAAAMVAEGDKGGSRIPPQRRSIEDLPTELRCRSGCVKPVTRNVIGRSESGGLWASACCADAAHLENKLRVYELLGFEVLKVESI